MQFGTSSIFIALSFIFHISESTPLPGGLIIESTPLPGGIDPGSQAGLLKSQVTETQRQLNEERFQKARLTHQLEEARVKAQSQARLALTKRLEVERQAAEQEQKLRQGLRQATAKLSETEKKRQETDSKLATVQDKLHASQEHEADTKKKLADTKNRLADTELDKITALDRLRLFKASAARGMKSFKAAAKKKLMEEAAKTKDAQLKHADTLKKLDEARKQKQLAETKMQDAQVGQHNAELRTFRLAIRGAVRGGTGVVKQDGKVERWRIR